MKIGVWFSPEGGSRHWPTNLSIDTRIAIIGHHCAWNPPGDAAGHLIGDGSHGFGDIEDA